ncbi:MAG: hypothetical protein QN152_09055 [Armatimonadota bacterium]|nr:hypothetical protein [Armatimonadota bacterium]MDR7463143.1 hypothetical protein [Armatimonadota bacterium]MDR7468870.1 hypothetical protein [Armatimonadota bacterium]MDR7539660.1 hypothetical protein [Armatimonadota bacterium]
MIDVPLEIPERSGEVVLVPPAADLVEVARENRDRLGMEELLLGGTPLQELRRQARQEVLALGRAYSAALGAGPVPEGELLLATGHQPVFPHPGIWVKYLLLDRLAARGHTGLAVVVDSDAMEQVGVDVPSRHASFLERRREVLRTAAPEEPYEGQAAPGGAEWSDFLQRIDRHVRSLESEAVRRPWEAFRALPPPAARDYPAFVTALRRRYEGPRRYLDVPLSAACESVAFRAFFLHIAAGAARFLEVHNAHLQAYRGRQRIRTEAQPFPDLQREGELIELPFWTLAGGRRRRLFLDGRRRALRVAGGEREGEWSFPNHPADPRFAHLRLRPRALTLTAFLRLLVVDLFIHGISGGRYDRVTDAVIADFFGIAPPHYAVASATLHLPLGQAANPEATRRSLQRLLLQARHNPERLLTAPTARQEALVAQKWELIRRLEAPGLTRRERRAATQSIRALNAQLCAALADRIAAWEEALRTMEQHSAPSDAATYRGYPYFLYEREQVEALVTRMLEGGA